MKSSPKVLTNAAFDPQIFLALVDDGQSVKTYMDRQSVFAQGDPADAIFYIHKGKIKLTVVSQEGKEAVVAILESGQFFGEGCLVAQTSRMHNGACAMQEASPIQQFLASFMRCRSMRRR
jgi:CRP-like cAMP-binding protein